MRTRHRIPSIFSIYMVDVLCCALGCVILLWQVNFFEAEEKTAQAMALADSLKESNLSIDSKSGLLVKAKEREDALKRTIDLLKTDWVKNEEALKRALANLKTESEKNQEAMKLTLDMLAADAQKSIADAKKLENKLVLALEASKLDAEKYAKEGKDLTTKLADVTIKLKVATADHDKERKIALVFKKDYEDAKKAEADLEKAKAALAFELERMLLAYKKLEKSNVGTTADLATQVKLLKNSEAAIALLQKELEDKRGESLALDKRIKERVKQLEDADAKQKKLDAELVQLMALTKDYERRLQVSGLRSKVLEQDNERLRLDIADTRKKNDDALTAFDLLKRRNQISTKELEEAYAMVAVLKKRGESLTEMANKIKVAAENRFAGITLTGNRIVFLVDMSGSMEYVEERTLDPDKWPIVCETLAKIMGSVPDLKQYQVILFSDRARYPLGGDGRWLEYQGPGSVKLTLDTVKATKPQGETNLHSAFTEAFRYRELGMDTIYLLSDGLPTAGDGLAAAAAGLTDAQKTEILSKNLRNRLKTVWNRPAGVSQTRVRINTIGFFYESPDVGAFLWALAREHDGSFVGMSRP